MKGRAKWGAFYFFISHAGDAGTYLATKSHGFRPSRGAAGPAAEPAARVPPQTVPSSEQVGGGGVEGAGAGPADLAAKCKISGEVEAAPVAALPPRLEGAPADEEARSDGRLGESGRGRRCADQISTATVLSAV